MKRSTQQEYRKQIAGVLVIGLCYDDPEVTPPEKIRYEACVTVDTIKMTRKFAGQQDYVVSKLEAQWWLDGESCDFANTPEKLKTILRVPVRKRGT